MRKSKLEVVIDDIVKTASVAAKNDSSLLEKKANTTITSVLSMSLVKVAEALKAAQSEVTYEDLKEVLK